MFPSGGNMFHTEKFSLFNKATVVYIVVPASEPVKSQLAYMKGVTDAQGRFGRRTIVDQYQQAGEKKKYGKMAKIQKLGYIEKQNADNKKSISWALSQVVIKHLDRRSEVSIHIPSLHARSKNSCTALQQNT